MTKTAKREVSFQVVSDRAGRNTVKRLAEELEQLDHARECDGTDANGRKCRKGEDWHNEEQAQAQIQEGPLSVEVRSGWHAPGEEDVKPEEYNILLGTGGPAARIVGDLDSYGQPESAHYEYQDWYKPWTRARLTSDEEETLLAYAQNFYFGE